VTARPGRAALALAALWWIALTAVVIAVRPATVADETRYLAVAWQMHTSGDGLLLRLNGELYGHKPPLLFWLFEAGWRVMGVHLWWPRIVTAAFGLGALVVVYRLGRRLVPEHDEVAALAALLTASSLVWVAFAGAVMFDLALALFVLVAVWQVARAAAGRGWGAWSGAGLALGLGILVKGPVALLHVLPLALLAPWWAGAALRARPGGTRAWYAGVALAVVIAAAVAFAWALPAAFVGGAAFRDEILWRQSAGRLGSEGFHARPVWFHLVVLPALLLPWFVSATWWRGLAGAFRARRSTAVRFAVAWVAPVFVAFTLMKGKQLHYLLPEVPAFALLAAFGLQRAGAAFGRADRWSAALGPLLVAAVSAALAPWLLDEGVAGWRVALAIALPFAGALAPLAVGGTGERALVATAGSAWLASIIAVAALLGPALLAPYDVQPFARAIAEVQQRGHPVAHLGKYHGEYQFTGRLQTPLQVVHGPQAAVDWARAHPTGVVVVRAERALPIPEGALLAARRYRTGHVYLVRSEDTAAAMAAWSAAGASAPAD
jgi:4-amino-4-deoxy-L-arabinose transferase-like glycosyltransferase